MAWRIRALTALTDIWSQFPELQGGSLPPITLASGDPAPSSVNHRHEAHTWYTYIYADKPLTHINKS